MLKCSEVVEKADAIVDGDEMRLSERLALRLHLLMCHHCRRYVRQLRQLVAHFRRADEPAPPETVEQIMDALDSRSEEN